MKTTDNYTPALRTLGPVTLACTGCRHSVDFQTNEERDRFVAPAFVGTVYEYPGWYHLGNGVYRCPVCEDKK